MTRTCTVCNQEFESYQGKHPAPQELDAGDDFCSDECFETQREER